MRISSLSARFFVFGLMATGATTLVGCGNGAHVPSDLAGDVPVVVVNDTSANVCAFSMLPKTGGSQPENWLGQGSAAHIVKSKQHVDFKVRAGSYQLIAGTCDSPIQTGVVESFNVTGPTYVSLRVLGDVTSSPSSPPAGSTPVEMTLAVRSSLAHPLPPGQCLPKGAAATDFNQCCSQTLDHTHGVCD